MCRAAVCAHVWAQTPGRTELCTHVTQTVLAGAPRSRGGLAQGRGACLHTDKCRMDRCVGGGGREEGEQVQELCSPSPPPAATRTADSSFLSQVPPFSPTASPPFRAPIAPQHQFPASGLKVIFSRERVREILDKAENLPWSAVLPDRGHPAIPPPPPHPHWGRYNVLQSLIHQTKVRDRTVIAKGQARHKGDGALRWASTHTPAGPSPHNRESHTGPVPW